MIVTRHVQPFINCSAKPSVWRRTISSAPITEETVPRITLPNKLHQRLQKLKLRKQVEHFKKRTSKFAAPMVISCKREEYNHRRGQTYSNFNPQHLASHGWKHRKSRSDFFTINAHSGNPALLGETEDITSFEQLGLRTDLVSALEKTGITTPTNIQALSVPHMLDGRNVLVAAETGSGKTLSYLLPIIEFIKGYADQYGQNRVPNAPRAVVLVPSRELADQIHGVCVKLAEHIPFVTSCAIGGVGTKKILRHRPQSIADVLISTPGILSKMVTNKLYDLSLVQQLVLDEADSLLDDSFSEVTRRLVKRVKVRGEELPGPAAGGMQTGTQIAIVGATLPRSLDSVIGDIVPLESIERIQTGYLHKLLPHVPQKFLRVGTADKAELLLTSLQSNVKRKLPTIVFCNKSSTSNYVGHFLQDQGVPHIRINGKMPQELREGRFQEFQEGKVDILLCTDAASRGLDTIRVQHIINYDFPNFMSDYIHRVGRVGRVGSKTTGFVLNFVSQPWEVELLWQIETSVRRMKELHNVNANIKRKLVSRHNKEDMEAIIGL